MKEEIDYIQMLNNKMKQLYKDIASSEKLLVKALKKYKEENNISGRQMASKLNISPSYLCDIELGRRGISLNLLNKLSKIV